MLIDVLVQLFFPHENEGLKINYLQYKLERKNSFDIPWRVSDPLIHVNIISEGRILHECHKLCPIQAISHRAQGRICFLVMLSVQSSQKAYIYPLQDDLIIRARKYVPSFDSKNSIHR